MLLVALCTLTSLSAVAGEHWRQLAHGIAQSMAKAEEAFARGEQSAAIEQVRAAYRKFEDGKFEAAIRVQRGPKRMLEVERMFVAVLIGMQASDRLRVTEANEALAAAIASEAGLLDDENVPPEVFRVNQ